MWTVYFYSIFEMVYVGVTAWEIYRVYKYKKSKRRALWMISWGLWLIQVGIYLEGNQGARDFLTGMTAMNILLCILLNDVLYENSKTSEEQISQ